MPRALERNLTETSDRSPEKFVADKFNELRANAQRRLADVEAHTQLHPHQTILWALGAGYALRVFPTTRILTGVTRLAMSLLKPAALVYGVSKLWQISRERLPSDPS